LESTKQAAVLPSELTISLQLNLDQLPFSTEMLSKKKHFYILTLPM
jgi:hypothetical protein